MSTGCSEASLQQLAASLIKDGLTLGALVALNHDTMMLLGLDLRHGAPALVLMGSKGTLTIYVGNARLALALGVLELL